MKLGLIEAYFKLDLYLYGGITRSENTIYNNNNTIYIINITITVCLS